MNFRDCITLSLSAVFRQRMRSFLTALGIAVGIASVVLLTSIGEGVHKFVLSEFTQFGTNLIAVTAGKTTTHGMSGAMIGNVRPMTPDDALSLRHIPGILGVVPFVQGNAPIQAGSRTRRGYIFGVGSEVPSVWLMKVTAGRFLPDDDLNAARAFVVLGSKIRKEIFGQENPLGQHIRIGGERFRVIGVMESKGQMLGFDLDDAVYIPAARALSMFNRESLMEIDILYREGLNTEHIVGKIKKILTDRHGREDFTIVTQDQMLDVLGSVLNILTLAVGALGGISLLVGGVGILTIMTIAIQERTSEVGLLRAIGADRQQIITIFIGEAMAISAIGGLAGLILGAGGAWIIGITLPALPTHTPWSYAILAEILAVLIGLVAGVLPAYRAARMDPVEALRTE